MWGKVCRSFAWVSSTWHRQTFISGIRQGTRHQAPTNLVGEGLKLRLGRLAVVEPEVVAGLEVHRHGGAGVRLIVVVVGVFGMGWMGVYVCVAFAYAGRLSGAHTKTNRHRQFQRTWM